MQVTVEASRSGRERGQWIPALVCGAGSVMVLAVHVGFVAMAFTVVITIAVLLVLVRIGTDISFRRCNRQRGASDLLRAPATVNNRVGVVSVQPSVLKWEPQRARDAPIALALGDIAHIGLAPGNTPWVARGARLTITSTDGHDTRMTVTAPADAVLDALRSLGTATP